MFFLRSLDGQASNAIDAVFSRFLPHCLLYVFFSFLWRLVYFLFIDLFSLNFLYVPDIQCGGKEMKLREGVHVLTQLL